MSYNTSPELSGGGSRPDGLVVVNGRWHSRPGESKPTETFHGRPMPALSWFVQFAGN